MNERPSEAPENHSRRISARPTQIEIPGVHRKLLPAEIKCNVEVCGARKCVQLWARGQMVGMNLSAQRREIKMNLAHGDHIALIVATRVSSVRRNERGHMPFWGWKAYECIEVLCNVVWHINEGGTRVDCLLSDENGCAWSEMVYSRRRCP